MILAFMNFILSGKGESHGLSKASIRWKLPGKKLFLRVDFNVPIDKNGKITDDTRIQAILPTINYALSKNAKIILASHLGRPKGKPELQYSLTPVARRLGQLLKKEVKLAPDCIGPEVEKMAAAMNPGDVILLENFRFHQEEEKNDPGLFPESGEFGRDLC